MKARMFLLALAVSVVLCAGCAPWQAPVVPPAGAFYTHYRAPLTGDVNKVEVDGKTGRATTRYFRFFYWPIDFSWADASFKEAAKDGGHAWQERVEGGPLHDPLDFSHPGFGFGLIHGCGPWGRGLLCYAK